jgi:hypothetical protein
LLALEVLGGALAYVGFVLVINGLNLLGKIEAKDAAMINLFAGIVTFTSAYYNLFIANSPIAWAQGLLFSFTYFWVFANIVRGVADQRAFGWYCLMVAVTAVISGSLTSLADIGSQYLAFLWFEWAALWASFWVLLVLKRGTKPIGYFTIISGIVTYVPAFLYMLGTW